MMFRLAAWSMVVGLGVATGAFGQNEANPAATAASDSNMGVLRPAVLSLQETLDGLRVEKWKASREAKASTVQNIDSIRRDVEGTLPGLVTAADAAPGSLAAMLPVTRNVGALYDVVLRVAVIAESAAPADQADALEKSLSTLESARRTLADRQQQMAATEDAKVSDLRKQLNARPALAPVCPQAVAAVPVRIANSAAAKRKKKLIKPSGALPSAAPKPPS